MSSPAGGSGEGCLQHRGICGSGYSANLRAAIKNRDNISGLCGISGRIGARNILGRYVDLVGQSSRDWLAIANAVESDMRRLR